MIWATKYWNAWRFVEEDWVRIIKLYLINEGTDTNDKTLKKIMMKAPSSADAGNNGLSTWQQLVNAGGLLFVERIAQINEVVPPISKQTNIISVSSTDAANTPKDDKQDKEADQNNS